MKQNFPKINISYPLIPTGQKINISFRLTLYALFPCNRFKIYSSTFLNSRGHPDKEGS